MTLRDLKALSDPLDLMNALCRWPDPPPPDQRWEKTVAAACEVAASHKADVLILTPYYVAGRDMHDTVKRFIERLDAKAPQEVIDSYIAGMRRDLPKWDEANATATKVPFGERA